MAPSEIDVVARQSSARRAEIGVAADARREFAEQACVAAHEPPHNVAAAVIPLDPSLNSLQIKPPTPVLHLA